MKCLTLFFLYFCFSSIDGYNILIHNPKWAFSHMNFLGKIADTLAEAGHTVTVLQPLVNPKISSNGSTKAHLIQVEIDKEITEELDTSVTGIMKDIWVLSATNPIGVLAPIPLFRKIFTAYCRNTLDNTKVMDYLKSQKFDVAITEVFEFSGFAIFHEIGVKNIVGAHSATLFEPTASSIGLPVLPSFVPSSMGVTTDDTSFSTRATNTLFSCLAFLFEYSISATTQSLMNERHGDNAPKIWDMIKNITWHVTNSEPLIDFPRPSIHTVTDLGGIGVAKPKKLDDNWNDILNLRPKTVLVSFGSIAPSTLMSPAMKSSLVSCFARFPDVTFIWKYENLDESFAVETKNILLSKWTPQNDLLADRRLTAFITHGGAGSIYEAATYGKPLLAIPLFGDQSRNAHMVARIGMGIFYKKSDLDNADLFYKSLQRLLTDQSVVDSAMRAKNILAARPVTAQNKLVSTIEMAAAFGQQPLLRPAGASLGYITYYNIDVLVAVFLILLSILLFVISICVYCVKRKYGASKDKKE